ncbi:SprT family zinc-dependent metalloprotease [Lachnospiraceae bacterium 47-T17]
MKEIILDGITISVTKKSIKNMYLRVSPPDGRVRITAPSTVSDDAIRRFAVSRISWIKKQKEYFEAQSGQGVCQYVTGEYVYLWGKGYRLDVRHSDAGTDAFIEGEHLILQVSRESTPPRRAHVLNEWYRKEMKQAVPDILKKCEGIVGVQAGEWRIKNMRTRWGTCNIQKKRIWLNLQLAKRPPECLEYVIIHELVHLLERNHNAKFYEYMDSFCPDWRERRQRLNRGKG